MPSFTTGPLAAPRSPQSGGLRLVFSGVEQAGASFEARVFLNRPDADESTPRTANDGYVGSFHVFGYGDAAPPQMIDAIARKTPGDDAVAPIEKAVIVSGDDLRRAVGTDRQLSVTVVTTGAAGLAQPFKQVTVVADSA